MNSLRIALDAVRNLLQVLVAARRAHIAAECMRMVEPILLELQQREQEMLEYLSQAEAKAPA
jgi:hypothetical protein